jgi:hypothetical protein
VGRGDAARIGAVGTEIPVNAWPPNIPTRPRVSLDPLICPCSTISGSTDRISPWCLEALSRLGARQPDRGRRPRRWAGGLERMLHPGRTDGGGEVD